MESLRPNAQRAKNAITLIWIVLGIEIFALASGLLQYFLLQDAANGVLISEESASANDLREMAIGIIYTIAFITSAVTFISWFRRAYFNLHLKVSGLSHSEGWAAGCWFVPIISLFRPYQIMKELYVQTKGLIIKNGLAPYGNFNTQNLGWWWALWIINNFLGQFIFRYSRNAESIDQLTVLTIASMLNNIVGVPLALITIKVIKDYSKMEELLPEIKDEDGTNGNSTSQAI
ncbi:MAG: DUF4328 domain-containing protein [Sphingobacteriaceae bacterium]|nr:DUF4328 domain-containing protein [Sphingobacteriaceae bacterium]MBK7816726.1 DUF4328 domain-containing protein [Sphingobacteriaceae bacterium]